MDLNEKLRVWQIVLGLGPTVLHCNFTPGVLFFWSGKPLLGFTLALVAYLFWRELPW